ncbi:hypothetical protein QFC19_003392 [Naganishia cerealis]|uniref:Uncharacterized protein n=1 Tax=Naganishia cerealis TaxID=610337 RepID=A0ACC2W3P1_9TREE|nr:hypothetical protein QFC19_003392 [Naganishia cerealis]
MPHMVTEVTNFRGALTTDFRDVGSQLQTAISALREDLECLDGRVERGHERQARKAAQMGTVLGFFTGVLRLIANGVFETRLRLPEENQDGASMLNKGLPGADQGDSSMNEHDTARIVDSSHENNATSSQERSPVNDSETSPIMDPQTHQNEPATNPKSSRAPAYSSLGSLLQAAGHEAESMRVDALAVDVAGVPVQSERPGSHVTRPASFVLEVNHATVSSLWKEWYNGVFGRPSIVAMLERKLPKCEGQRKLFAHRKIIIDEVARLATARSWRRWMNTGPATSYLSITKLQDEIKRKNAEGGCII